MSCTAKLFDSGTNDSIDFYGIGGDYVDGATVTALCRMQESSLSLPTPRKIQVLSGESPFRHGQDLIQSSYDNREITFSFRIQSTTATDIPERLVLINKFLERARQYAIWNVRRGVELWLDLKGSRDPDNTYYIKFDVLDGELGLPETAWDAANYRLVDGQYMLYDCTLRLVCKPFGRGNYERLANNKTLYMNDEGLNYIYIYDASRTAGQRFEKVGVTGLINYAAQDYFYPFPSNNTDGLSSTSVNNVPGNGDITYFGALSKFAGVSFSIERVAVYTACTFIWEYWNGSAWTTISYDYDAGSTDPEPWGIFSAFKTAGRHTISWTIPSDWQKTTVTDGAITIENAYYMRLRLFAPSGWTVTPRQEWDIVHRNRDNKLYVDKTAIKGDAPSPVTVVIKSKRISSGSVGAAGGEPWNSVLYPSTQLKVFGLSRYRIRRLRGLYEAERAENIYTSSDGQPWAAVDSTNDEVTASCDDFVRFRADNTTEGKALRWKISPSLGMVRERWGNYAFSIRYRDVNASSGQNWRAKLRAYIYSTSNNQIYGEESRWYDLPSPYGTVVGGGNGGRWTTVDIAQFPMPPAAISYQTGYFVYVELWLKRTTTTPASAYIDIDYMYMWPTDQSYLNARTRFDKWYSTSDNSLTEAPYALVDSEYESMQLVNDEEPVESDPVNGTSTIAIAGFDEYQAGRFPWVVPGQDWMLGVYTKNATSNRFDSMEDTVEVDVWYAPRYILIGDQPH